FFAVFLLAVGSACDGADGKRTRDGDAGPDEGRDGSGRDHEGGKGPDGRDGSSGGHGGRAGDGHDGATGFDGGSDGSAGRGGGDGGEGDGGRGGSSGGNADGGENGGADGGGPVCTVQCLSKKCGAVVDSCGSPSSCGACLTGESCASEGACLLPGT